MFRVFLKDLSHQAGYLYRGVLLAAVLGMAFLFWKDNRGRIRARLKELLHQRWLILFLMYTGFLWVSTLLGRPITVPYNSILRNLVPGRYWATDREILENTLLYIPYTFLMLQAFRPKRPLRAALILAAGTSVFIEASQLLFWLGEFQLTDMVYNTAGGVLGWVLYMLCRKAFHRENRMGDENVG